MSDVQSAILLHLQADTNVTALVGTRIYPGVAPDGTSYPLIVVNPLGNARNELTYGASVNNRQGRWAVKAIDKGTTTADVGDSHEIAKAIETSLHNAALTLEEGACLACLCVGDIAPYSEIAGKTTYWHEGRVFEVMTA